MEKTGNVLRRSLCRKGLDVVAAFSWIDANIDGRVHGQQLARFLKHFGYEVTEKHCQTCQSTLLQRVLVPGALRTD